MHGNDEDDQQVRLSDETVADLETDDAAQGGMRAVTLHCGQGPTGVAPGCPHYTYECDRGE